jgi:uncharacterized membrane protein YphA (DoxX/SURF4 family)
MKFKLVFLWICRILAALILLQTLFFKFSAAPESVYIFSKIHAEPWGRIGSGIMELIAGILLIIPRTSVFGAIIAIGIMAGAIAAHLFVIGINVMDDGGQLFIYAVLVLFASLYIVWASRSQLAQLMNKRSYAA